MNGSRFFRASCVAAMVTSLGFAACSGWDPSRPFEREAPEVRESITLLGDGGDAAAAGGVLEEYLVTGQCKEGNIGTPNRVRERPNGSFDLGIALFKIGESFGRRFGDEEIDGGHMDGPLKTLRQAQVECGLRIVRAVATDPSQPIDLRARARFLEGNLCFLDQRYEDAVKAYDQSLELIPGMSDAGPIRATDGGERSAAIDALGRDTAWNRAIALRRIDDKKDAGKDSGDDGGGDGGGDSGGDSGKNDDKDGGGNDSNDGGNKKDSGGSPDAGKDASSDPKNDEKPKEEPKDAGPPPPSRQNQDERILDQLENAPTVQQEAAKKQAGKRRVRGMSDK